MGYSRAYTMLEVLAEWIRLPLWEFRQRCGFRLYGHSSLEIGKRRQTRWMNIARLADIKVSHISFLIDSRVPVDIRLDDLPSIAFGKLDLFYGVDSIDRARYLRKRIEDVAQHNEMHPESPEIFPFRLTDNKIVRRKTVRSTACGLLEAIFGDSSSWDDRDILESLSNGGPCHYGFQLFFDEYIPAQEFEGKVSNFYSLAKEHAKERDRFLCTCSDKKLLGLQDRLQKAKKLKRDHLVIVKGLL